MAQTKRGKNSSSKNKRTNTKSKSRNWKNDRGNNPKIQTKIRKNKQTKKLFPRKYNEIKRNPLY